MFSAFNSFGKLGALASSVARAWSPLALWPDGVSSAGMWISPSTLPASFNDSAGTTPVATPGTVADSANPVGLALDIRAGAPDTLGPELVTNRDFSDGATGWTADAGWVISGGQASISNVTTPIRYLTSPEAPTIVGRCYQVTFSVLDAGGLECFVWSGTADIASITTIVSPGVYTASFVATTTTSSPYFAARNATDIVVGGVSVREIPGNHLSQSTSAARPVASGRKNLLVGTDALATQSVTVIAAQCVLSFTGTGTVTLSGASTAGPLVGTGASDRVSLTFTPTAGSLTLTVSGSVTFAQLEYRA